VAPNLWDDGVARTEEAPTVSDETITIPPPPPIAPTPSEPPSPSSGPSWRRPVFIAGTVAVVLAILAVVVFAVPKGGEDASAQPLALSFEAGQSQSYMIHQTMDGTISSDLLGGDQPIKLDMTQRVTWEVTHVDDQGVATIQVTVDQASGTVDGTPIPQSDIPPIEFQVAPDGRIVSAGGLALGGASLTQGFGFPGMGQMTPILPDEGQAVAPGDTWEKTFSQDFPYGSGKIEFTATSRYDRNETVDGKQAAVIVTDMKVPLDFTLNLKELLDALGGADAMAPTGASGLDALADASLAYSGNGTISQTSWVDLEAKQLLKSSSSGDFDITMSFSGIPDFEGKMRFAGSYTQDLAVA
jgi:hypothetical protein